MVYKFKMYKPDKVKRKDIENPDKVFSTMTGKLSDKYTEPTPVLKRTSSNPQQGMITKLVKDEVSRSLESFKNVDKLDVEKIIDETLKEKIVELDDIIDMILKKIDVISQKERAIPEKGEKGDTGSQGPPGEIGTQGPQGPQGDKGLLNITNKPLVGNLLKYDDNDEWTAFGHRNIYVGQHTMDDDIPGKSNIGLGNKSGLGQINSSYCIALGESSGGRTVDDGTFKTPLFQKDGGISIGAFSSENGQGQNSISIGFECCKYYPQEDDCIAIGAKSSSGRQKDRSIIIGTNSGNNQIDSCSILIGTNSGKNDIGYGAVVVGTYAANSNIGDYSVCLGFGVGEKEIPKNTIVIDASGDSEGIEIKHNNSLYIKKIRIGDGVFPNLKTLMYDTQTCEVVCV